MPGLKSGITGWRRILIALALAILLPAPGSASGDYRGALAALRSMDMRLAGVATHLLEANAPLCDAIMPSTGLVLHALAQYPARFRSDARAVFLFPTPLAVEGVISGSAAATAGVAVNDGIVAINGKAIANHEQTGSALRDEAMLTMGSLSATSAISIDLVRAGRVMQVTLRPRPACRSRFEVLPQAALKAQSDGEIIQVSTAVLERFDDSGLAVIVAHELAHSMLHHRKRLAAAGVRTGILAEFGANRRLLRRAEDEADRLSVHLLRNAGHDPMMAVNFWRGPGRRIDRGIFRSGTHASARQRAEALQAEIAAMPMAIPLSIAPSLLESRTKPFD